MRQRERQRFVAGGVHYDGDISTGYQAGRALSAESAEVWCAVLDPLLAPFRQLTVLDLGCGTGRFSTVIAKRYGARVIGVEPSQQMLSIAVADRPPPTVSYASGRAESLPLHGCSCDVAWLSHVIHHIADREACASELGRVLRPDGRVLIRGTFGDRTDGFPTLFHFFPGAREVADEFPTLNEVTGAFDRAGVAIETLRRIQQKTCESLRELASRTRLRADSTLALLPDPEFERGQSALAGCGKTGTEA